MRWAVEGQRKGSAGAARDQACGTYKAGAARPDALEDVKGGLGGVVGVGGRVDCVAELAQLVRCWGNGR